MLIINSALLKQFHENGLSINEGVAVDERLVKSVSKPISNKLIDDLKQKRKTPEGKLDKNGNPRKFTRDFESDWTIKNNEPHYGLKEHTAVDTENGFIISTNLTEASHHDSKYFPYAVMFSMHTKDKIQTDYADKGLAQLNFALRTS